MTAIRGMIEAMTGDETTARDHHLINKLEKRIADRGDERFGGCPALDYCNKWSGEWHVTNGDLQLWGLFKMWLYRSSCDTDMAGVTFQGISNALRCKRLFQAFERYQSTGLTKAHCNLLANMGWNMDMERGDWISLYVQGKRPFGNSSITYDIFEHANWEKDWPEDDGMSDDQEERAWEIFDELVFAAKDAALLAGSSLDSQND